MGFIILFIFCLLWYRRLCFALNGRRVIKGQQKYFSRGRGALLAYIQPPAHALRGGSSFFYFLFLIKQQKLIQTNLANFFSKERGDLRENLKSILLMH